MNTPEGKVKDQIKKTLKAHNAYYFMPMGQMYGRAGVPDFVGCLRGHMFAIEAKAGNNKPTALQELEMAKMRKVGAEVIVVNENNVGGLGEWLEGIPHVGP